MSSRIEQLIDEIEDYIESCKPKFMSSTEIIVNKDEIDELLRELRMKTPDEIKRYQKIIATKMRSWQTHSPKQMRSSQTQRHRHSRWLRKVKLCSRHMHRQMKLL